MLILRSIGIRASSAGRVSSLLTSSLRRSNQFSVFSKSSLPSLLNTKRFNSTQTTKTPQPELTPEEIKLASELTWEQFLSLRKQQRRISLLGSGLAAMLAITITYGYTSQIELDLTETIFGLDTFTVLIGGIMSMGVVGFLLGPSLLGDPLFALAHRSVYKAFSAKQKLFLKHIIKRRVDASRQSMNNPVPDYYGEKIGSLKDYRQWLRDGYEYKRKAREFL